MKKLFLILTITIVSISLKAQNIPMTFHNGSDKSIQLIIPGVMNPNLNPFSNSGIGLDVGQKVYFYTNGNKKNKALLFEVDNSFKKDAKIEIDALIEKRKKELLKNED